MKFVQMTKLVSGYIPTRVWVNPDKIDYVEEIVQRRGQGGDTFIEVPMGTRVHFNEGSEYASGSIDVRETPETVVQWLQWEFSRERTSNGADRG